MGQPEAFFTACITNMHHDQTINLTPKLTQTTKPFIYVSKISLQVTVVTQKA